MDYKSKYYKYKSKYINLKRDLDTLSGGKKNKKQETEERQPASDPNKETLGMKKIGRDGNVWIVGQTKDGSQKWRLLTILKRLPVTL